LFDAVLIDGQSPAELIVPVLALPVVFALRAMVIAFRTSLGQSASSAIRRDLRCQLFATAGNASPAALSSTSVGAMTYGLVDRIETLDPYYARFLPQRASAVIIPGSILLVVALQNWLAAVLLAITAPAIPLFMALVGMGAARLSQHQAQATARLAGAFHDKLRGLDIIQRFGATGQVIDRLSVQAEEFRSRTMSVLRLAFLSSAVLEFFSAVAIATLAIYIGLGLLGYIELGPSSQLTLASGLFILLLAPEFFSPLRLLAQSWHDRADALACAADLRSMASLPSGRTSPNAIIVATERLPVAACPVSIHSLSFSYVPDQPILDQVDLDVPAGQSILITSPSGGGKTTLLNLMAGFLEPETGQIRFDEVSLSSLTQNQLARCRGWVGQAPVLFDGSIAFNIGLGRDTVDRDRIRAVAGLCGIDGFAQLLPEGLETRLGQDGNNISGGQAQRIVLARALAEPRPVLFLDEPTASLDAHAEAGFWQLLTGIREQLPMTIICASHSRQAREWADRTVEIRAGTLHETTR